MHRGARYVRFFAFGSICKSFHSLSFLYTLLILHIATAHACILAASASVHPHGPLARRFGRRSSVNILPRAAQ